MYNNEHSAHVHRFENVDGWTVKYEDILMKQDLCTSWDTETDTVVDLLISKEAVNSDTRNENVFN